MSIEARKGALETYKALSDAADRLRHQLSFQFNDEASEDIFETLRKLEGMMDDLHAKYGKVEDNE